jgi:hypothetical protein
MRAMLLLIAAAGLLTNAAHAQGLREFCAERPGKATPPCILDAGHVQVETALADAVFERSRGAHQDTYLLGGTEIRMGLTQRLEAEAGWTPLILDHARGEPRRRGVGDAVFGLRGSLSDPDKAGPVLALQGFVTAPTATHGLGAGGWTGGVRAPASIPLGATDLGLTPEVDVLRDADGHGAHLAWIGVAGLSRGFGAATFGVELWGQMDDDPAGRAYQASADLTAALAMGGDAQLDAGVNLGLNRRTPDVEIYTGVAKRF